MEQSLDCSCTASLINPTTGVTDATDIYTLGDCDEYKAIWLDSWINNTLNIRFADPDLTRQEWLQYITFRNHCSDTH